MVRIVASHVRGPSPVLRGKASVMKTGWLFISSSICIFLCVYFRTGVCACDHVCCVHMCMCTVCAVCDCICTCDLLIVVVHVCVCVWSVGVHSCVRACTYPRQSFIQYVSVLREPVGVRVPVRAHACGLWAMHTAWLRSRGSESTLARSG